MKRFCLFIVIAALAVTGCASAYNAQIFDTTWSFDKAVIRLPNGKIVEGEVDSWKDFEDGDQLQVKIDGKTYLTHSANVVLIQEG